jgi:4-hydroxy-3-methylbut-2-en-1-yl diphosphate synthase IspG/GcpE
VAQTINAAAGHLGAVSDRTLEKLEDRLAHIETPLTPSIIGCVVNGPGEALMTDLGVTGGVNGRHMIYDAGKMLTDARSRRSWAAAANDPIAPASISPR